MRYIRNMLNPIELAKKNMELQKEYIELYKKYRQLSEGYDSLRSHCEMLERNNKRLNTVYTVLFDEDGSTDIHVFSTKEKANDFFECMVRRCINEDLSQTGYSFEEYKDEYQHNFDEILKLGYFCSYSFYICVNEDIVDSNSIG